MKCPKCKFYNICKGRINETVENCVRFKSAEQTNEEWLKSLDTEGLVDHLYEVHKGGASVERQAWIEKHKERIKMQIRGWLKEKHDAE